MRLKQLFNDDDAVSPVIGVILMVAITVILAAVIATFVLGLGEQVSDSAPNANFQTETPDDSFTLDAEGAEADPDEGTIAEFTHTSGPAIDSDNLGLAGLSDDDIEDAVDEALEGVGDYDDSGDVSVETDVVFSDDDSTSASDTVALELTLVVEDGFQEENPEDGDEQTVTILEDEEVSIVWNADGSSATLRTHTINQIELTVVNVEE